MIRFWPPVIFRFAVVLGAALLTGFLISERAGYRVAIALLLVLIGFHLWYLHRVVAWLEDRDDLPDPDRLPHGFGAWSSVFRALRRARRREEDRRAELARELDRIIEASGALPDGIVILDAADRLEWCNPRATEHFGLDPQRDRGFSIFNLIRRPAFTEYVLHRDFSEPLVLADAPTERMFSVQMLPFQESRRMVISRDVSRLHRFEQMRRDLIANVSHELRTPLTVVAGFLEHVIDTPDLAAAERARIETLMLDQARRMRRLIDDLLTLARLESQTRLAAEATFDLVPFVDEAVAAIRGLSAGRHVVTAEAVPALTIQGGREELMSALENLLSNAVRYTPAGGTITVRATLDGRSLGLAVTDTGPGIAPEHIPRLTERFFRVDKSRSRETGGTGLGLAIVKHALALHGGTLEITSVPGQGSTFQMVLPAARVVSGSASAAMASANPAPRLEPH